MPDVSSALPIHAAPSPRSSVPPGPAADETGQPDPNDQPPRNETATCNPSYGSRRNDGTTHSRLNLPLVQVPQIPLAETSLTHLSMPWIVLLLWKTNMTKMCYPCPRTPVTYLPSLYT